MQLTAIGTVAVTIVLLGSFLYTRDALGRIGGQILNQIEVSVYLDDASTDSSALALRSQIARDGRIGSIIYVPKSEGLKQMRSRMAGLIDTSLMTSNPLPNAFRVRVTQPNDVPAVASRIASMHGVAKVNYAQDVVAKLLRLSQVIERMGIAVLAVLVSVAAIIISNTIRLTVFARRREIAIMQLVGATNLYIRAPFICEGLIDGLVGAAVAIGILAAVRIQVLPKVFSALPFVPLAHNGINEQLIIAEMLGVGAAVGIVASWVSVGRYLRT